MKASPGVLDDDALLDDHLLKLTRWMADYYLCGWGQVLHAVVPAGVRDNAGTRAAAFVEAVPRDELPNPLPTVTAEAEAGPRPAPEGGQADGTRPARPAARLRRRASIAGLVGKGLLRKFTRAGGAAASGAGGVREPRSRSERMADSDGLTRLRTAAIEL